MTSTLLERARSGDEDAQNQIYHDYHRLVYHIARKFKETYGVTYEDLISAGMLGFWKAVHTYAFDKGACFVTYASTCISNEMLQELKRVRKYVKSYLFNSIRLYDVAIEDSSGNSLLFEDIIGHEVLFEDAIITEDILKVINDELFKLAKHKHRPHFADVIQYIINGNTQADATHHFELSQSYISKVWRTFVKRLNIRLLGKGLILESLDRRAQRSGGKAPRIRYKRGHCSPELVMKIKDLLSNTDMTYVQIQREVKEVSYHIIYYYAQKMKGTHKSKKN